MELEKAIYERRSCRSYDREKHVSEEEMRKIIEAGTWAPSGTNSQPWRFTVLSGEAKTEFIEFFRGDLEKKKEGMTEQQSNIAFWSCLSLEKSDVIVLVWDKNKTWTSPQSIGANIQTMMLQAYGMGLGSLWVAAVRWSKQEITEKYGKQDMELIAGIGFGYPSDKMKGKKGPPRLSVDEVAEFLG